MVGEVDLGFTGFTPAYADFSYMASPTNPTANIGGDLLNAPFDGWGPLEQGIHLHWTLPRALRVADYGDGKTSVSVPPAPNRWLVTRALIDGAASGAPAVSFTSWVVESDFVDAGGAYSSTTIPFSIANSGQPFSYLGRVYDLATWPGEADGGTYLTPPLTAVGFGIPDFATCYPNCRNVFGMLDDGLNDGSFDSGTMGLIYSVTGWYSANDPLSGWDAADVARQFGWDGGDGGAVPSGTLLHGVVYALRWDSDGGFLSDQSSPLEVGVAFGNTPSEAFAAYAANAEQPDDPQSVETILNALQLGMLTTLNQPGGVARMEEAIHNAAFSSHSAGSTWRLKPTRRTGGAPPPADLPHRMGGLLAAQADLNRVTAETTSLQGRIFTDWYRYIIADYASDPPAQPSVEAMMSYVKDEVSALELMKVRQAALRIEVDALVLAIREGLPDSLELEEVPDDRYHAPREPVVVLSGDPLPAPLPEDADTIACAYLTGTAPSITLPAGLITGSAAVTLPATALPAPAIPDNLPAAAAAALNAAAGLLQLDLLAVCQTSELVAARIAAVGGDDNPAILDATTTASLIATAQADWLGGTAPASGIAFSIPLAPMSAIAYRSWTLPWQPIALSWECDFHPLLPVSEVSSVYGSVAITDGFDFVTNVSLNLQPKDPAFTDGVTMSGKALLSADASTSLQSQIAAYLALTPDPELQTILTDLGNVPVLSQALSGFNANLLGLAQTMQLPVGDPAAEDAISGDFSNRTVKFAVGRENRYAPGPGGVAAIGAPVYNGLRAGRFVLTRLALIDQFGRSRPVQMTTVAVSQAFQDTPCENGFVLPVRITQPARLEMTWLSADDPRRPSLGAGVDSAICGWVVPNVLDSSLMYYDADGAAIGSHAITASGLSWMVAPNAGPWGASIHHSFAGRNAALSAFASAVHRGGVGYAGSLLKTFERTQTFVLPDSHQQSRQTAMLVGTPLALVRMDMRLSLEGLPVPDQSFDAMAADIGSLEAPVRRTIHGLDDVEVPVVLGNQLDLNDGLVGFFKSARDGALDFDTCYAASADGSSPKVVPPGPTTVTLRTGAATARRLAMLIDPRAAVHVNTGLLPVQRIALPPDEYGAALAGMSFSFLTAPVIAPAGAFAMPTPSEGGGWTWITFANRAWTPTAIATPVQVATLQRPTNIQDGWLQLTQAQEEN